MLSDVIGEPFVVRRRAPVNQMLGDELVRFNASELASVEVRRTGERRTFLLEPITSEVVLEVEDIYRLIGLLLT